MKTVKTLLGMMWSEKILWNMGFAWLFIVACAPVVRAKWSLSALGTHALWVGIQHDLGHIMLVSTGFALAWGLIELALYLSSPAGGSPTKRRGE